MFTGHKFKAEGTEVKQFDKLEDAVKFASGRFRSVQFKPNGEVRHVRGRLLGYVESK